MNPTQAPPGQQPPMPMPGQLPTYELYRVGLANADGQFNATLMAGSTHLQNLIELVNANPHQFAHWFIIQKVGVLAKLPTPLGVQDLENLAPGVDLSALMAQNKPTR